MKKTIYLLTILCIFLFPIYGICQGKIAIFFDDFAFEDTELKNDADKAQSKLRTKFVNDPKINNCESLEIVTLENILNTKNVSKDHEEIWKNKLDTKNNIKFIPKGTNVFVWGRIKSDRVNHSIEVEVYDLRNPRYSKKISHSIVEDDYNFFQDKRELESKINSLYDKIFGESFFNRLKINCAPTDSYNPTTSDKPSGFDGSSKFAYHIGGTLLSLGSLYMGFQRMGGYTNFDTCPSLFPNKKGCNLYYDVYSEFTNPEGPKYPYSYKGESLSRDEVLKAANKRFQRDQILFLGLGTLGLLYTWKNLIPGWRKDPSKPPKIASNWDLSSDPILQIGSGSYGIGYRGGWGISLNRRF